MVGKKATLKFLTLVLLPLFLQSCKSGNREDHPPDYVCSKVSLDLVDRIEKASEIHYRVDLAFHEKEHDSIILTLEEISALRDGPVKELYLNPEAYNTVGGYVTLDCRASLIVLIKGSKEVSEMWQIWPIRTRIAFYDKKGADPLALSPPFVGSE
jgi:hypothetical protein